MSDSTQMAAIAFVGLLASLALFSSLTRPTVLPFPENDNLAFSFVEKTCAISSATPQMVGFKLNYTTGASGRIAVTMDFGINRATSGESSYRIAYGTGAAPGCNASATGTPTGDFHLVGNTPASQSFIIGVDIYAATLSPNTAYWFDLSINDSSTSVFTYADAELMVVQN